MVEPIGGILMKRPKDAFRSQQYLDDNFQYYGYLEPPNLEVAIEEYHNFESIIKEFTQKIYHLPFDERAGMDSIYTHDPVKITKKGAIYFQMSKELRRGESEAARDFLESAGVPTLGSIDGEGRMEGGDVVWLSERVVAIGRGYRTNDEGIRQFKEIMKDQLDEVIVVPLPHGEGESACLHLMSIISMIDHDLAVVYAKYMPVFFREYLLNKGIKLIGTNEYEYDYLGTNVLALSKKKCILLGGNDIMEKSLEDAGMEVYMYHGRNISFLGTGGPTCLTNPIFRGSR